MSTKTAAVFIHERFEEVEALTVVDLLRRVDIQTVMVSLEDDLEVTGSHGVKITCDIKLGQIEPTYDIYIIPGGPGINHLLENDKFIEQVKDWGHTGKKLAAICAAPQILSKAKLLKGKNITCFPTVEQNIPEANIQNASVVKDGLIVTSRGLGTAIDFSLAIIEDLLDKQTADRLAKSIVYNL